MQRREPFGGCWVLWSKKCQKRQRSERQPPVTQLSSSDSMNSRPAFSSEVALEARHRPAGQAGARQQDHVVGCKPLGLGLGQRVQRRLDEAEAAPAAGDAASRRARSAARRPPLPRARRRPAPRGRGRRSGSAPGRPRRPRPGCGRARPPPPGGRGRGSRTGASSRGAGCRRTWAWAGHSAGGRNGRWPGPRSRCAPERQRTGFRAVPPYGAGHPCYLLRRMKSLHARVRAAERVLYSDCEAPCLITSLSFARPVPDRIAW